MALKLPVQNFVIIWLKKLSDLHYRNSYGALLIIYKLPDPTQIFGPKAIIRLLLSDQATIIGNEYQAVKFHTAWPNFS
jgi:hypothetical protein